MRQRPPEAASQVRLDGIAAVMPASHNRLTSPVPFWQRSVVRPISGVELTVPAPYQPSHRRGLQAEPARRLTRRQVLWLLPLVALLPIAVVVAANAVTQRATSGGETTAVVGAPVAAAPTAASTATVAALLAPPTALTATPLLLATPAASGTAGSQPAPVTVEPQPTQANAPYFAYTVQSGDTINIVAERYGVPAASLAQASGLSGGDVLHVGQVLTVPRQAGWLYRVQPGETLEQIAARLGVPAQKIEEASSLQAASIRPGYVLLIPDQAAPDTAK